MHLMQPKKGTVKTTPTRGLKGIVLYTLDCTVFIVDEGTEAGSLCHFCLKVSMNENQGSCIGA